MTFEYSFSAPTATTALPPRALGVAAHEQARRATAVLTTRTLSRT
jgi:hypothetical protein